MYFDSEKEYRRFFSANCERCRWNNVATTVTLPACSVLSAISHEYHGFASRSYTDVAKIARRFTHTGILCPFIKLREEARNA